MVKVKAHYDATMPAVAASSAGAVLAADLCRVFAASVGLGAGMLLIVDVVAIAMREWSWTWLIWPLVGASLPPLALAVGSLVELVHSMAERIVQIDVDGEGLKGPPARFVAISPYTGRQALARDSAERDREHLAEFIRGCAVDTSLRRWEASISRETYQDYRDRLIDSGWAEWKQPGNERAGWRLTAPAEETSAGIWV